MVGGSQSGRKQSVEAITTNGTPLFKLSDLPDHRATHTIDNNIMCGGSHTTTSCLSFVAGKWTKYGNDLKTKRYHHVSWRKHDGNVVLIGGGYGKNTSEMVSSSGNQKGFDLKHDVQ